MKICNSCRIEKPEAMYWKRQKRCKTCQKIATTAWKVANPTATRRSERKSQLKLRYGLTLADFEALLIKQNGRCAICAVPLIGRTAGVDHCHKTQRIRGLLCVACNHGLGKFKDDSTLLQAAIDYLA